MPTSNLAAATAILWLIESCEPKPERVLDVGIGHGKYGLLMREYLNDPPSFIAGIEAEPSYLDRFPWTSCLYDELGRVDVRDLDDEYLALFDLVLMVDVIEHLPKDDGLALLDRIPGHVVICTPVEFFDNPETVESERHRSVWSVADFGPRLDVDSSQLGGVIVRLKRREP